HAHHRVEAFAVAQDEGADAAAEIDKRAARLAAPRAGDVARHLLAGFLAGDVAGFTFKLVGEPVPLLAVHGPASTHDSPKSKSSGASPELFHCRKSGLCMRAIARFNA